jgi:hypothetical protein
MTDYAEFATPSGVVYLATIGADGLIHGLTTCALDCVGVHLLAEPAAVPILPAEALKFGHGTPFALVDGAVVSAEYPLATIQARAIAGLRAACNAAIEGGYTSAALGGLHTYPALPTDQANMIASVTASLLPGLAAAWTTPFWCVDITGAWAMRAHTAAQIQQAGSDGKAAIVAAQQRLAALAVRVTAATSAAEASAITW